MTASQDFLVVDKTYEIKLGRDHHKMNPEIKERWIEALRSGEYSQTQRQLADPDGFCCLGVLCEIALADGIVFKSPERTTRANRFQYASVHNPDDEESTVPPLEVVKWADFSRQNPIFRVPESFLDDYPDQMNGRSVDLDGTVGISLADLNDNFGFTFDQIADVIEEYF